MTPTVENVRTMMPLVWGAFLSALILHVDRLPLWCSAAALITTAWSYLHWVRGRALPGRFTRVLLALMLLGATLATFNTVNGVAAGSAMLTAMGAIKLLETQQRRDAQVCVIVALVMLLAAILDRQSLLRLPLYLLVGWICMTTLTGLGGFRIATRAEPPSKLAPLKRAAFAHTGKSLLLALPLTALLFVFVPRLPGALWPMPGSGQAATGLSESMSPGSISELAVSDTPVFRVSFSSGRPPPPNQRYWRGPVLHEFDGYTWSRARPGSVPPQRINYLGSALDYEVLMEATGQNWLFGLETLQSLNRRGVHPTSDGEWMNFRPLVGTVSYAARSYPEAITQGQLPRLTRRLDTGLPADRNPRSLALGRSLREATADDRDYVRRVLTYLQTGGFSYTLTPPLLDLDSVDDLLFNTRQGFCGHYASAFATLMRAAGLPARVVTGYLGGQWNEIGDFLLLRQSDAHAWVEVWVEDAATATGTWLRVDPTAVVAPQRLSESAASWLPTNANDLRRLGLTNPLLGRMLNFWDASNHWFESRVVRYNRSVQQSMLARLRLPQLSSRTLGVIAASLIGVWCLALWWLQQHRSQSRPTEPAYAKRWRRLLRHWQQRGLRLPPHLPPLALIDQAALHWPDQENLIRSVGARYIDWRFNDHAPDPDAARRFKRDCQALARLR